MPHRNCNRLIMEAYMLKVYLCGSLNLEAQRPLMVQLLLVRDHAFAQPHTRCKQIRGYTLYNNNAKVSTWSRCWKKTSRRALQVAVINQRHDNHSPRKLTDWLADRCLSSWPASEFDGCYERQRPPRLYGNVRWSSQGHRRRRREHYRESAVRVT